MAVKAPPVSSSPSPSKHPLLRAIFYDGRERHAQEYRDANSPAISWPSTTGSDSAGRRAAATIPPCNVILLELPTDADRSLAWVRRVAEGIVEDHRNLIYVVTLGYLDVGTSTAEINLSGDPFDISGEGNASLDDLDGVILALERAAQPLESSEGGGLATVLFESITPLLVVHEALRVTAFLSRVRSLDGIGTVILPVHAVDGLQSFFLQDYCDGFVTFHLGAGEDKEEECFVLLKHRSGKVEVSAQPYSFSDDGLVLEDIDEDEVGGETDIKKESNELEVIKEIEGVQPKEVEITKEGTVGSLTDALHSLGRQFDQPKKKKSGDAGRSSVRGKVTLQMERDEDDDDGDEPKNSTISKEYPVSSTTVTPPSKFNISVEDDDPEFDDLDEEDPDDDLDL